MAELPSAGRRNRRAVPREAQDHWWINVDHRRVRGAGTCGLLDLVAAEISALTLPRPADIALNAVATASPACWPGGRRARHLHMPTCESRWTRRDAQPAILVTGL